ncbi:MAG: DUF1365 domain-containing protein [Pseudomonadota bacterium]
MSRPKHHIVKATTYHARYGKTQNAFRYGVNYVLLQMIDDRPYSCRTFSRNRWNITAFYDKDHGKGNNDSLEWALGVADRYNIDRTKASQVWLLTQPRTLGYIFNPVSFWFFTDPDNALYAVIAEVNNTFGDRHSYICFHDDQRPITSEDNLKAQKVFHVSPYQIIEGEYIFRFNFNIKNIGVWIDYKRENGGVYTTLTGNCIAMTDLNVLKMLLRYPLGALRVIALIYWQAIKLAFKGAQYQTRPEPPPDEVSR